MNQCLRRPSWARCSFSTETGQLQGGRKRVARLMREDGLVGAHQRRPPRTTSRDRDAAPAPDLVQRQFRTPTPDRLWVADITYVRTGAGWLYLGVVLDVFSRRVVGWAMSAVLETTLVLDALNMALWNRWPAAGVAHHSDRGVQYTSLAYGRRCREAGVVPSMGTAGDAYDNALAEAFFATLETELLMRQRFIDHGTARRALFAYIEGWYNPHRRHSALGYLSPAEFLDYGNSRPSTIPAAGYGCPSGRASGSTRRYISGVGCSPQNGGGRIRRQHQADVADFGGRAR